MSSTRPLVLFSPCYAEPLKAMLPHIRAMGRSFDVFVLNTVSWVGDQEKAERILRQEGLKFATEHELVASHVDFNWLARVIRSLDFRARRVTRRIAHDSLLQYALERRWRRLATKWLDKVQPVAIVVAGEQNPIQKHLIHEANRRGIPSVTLQWGIANAAPQHTREMLMRTQARAKAQASLPARARQTLVNALAGVTIRAAGLSVSMPSPIFGGGHATAFAVIGDGCRANYIRMGIPARKMAVIGYPTYEELHRSADRLAADTDERRRVLQRFAVPEEEGVVLWCTNDQRGYYAGFREYAEMLDSWRAKLQILLDLTPCTVIVRLHPKELLSDYMPLIDVSHRVRIVCDESSTRDGRAIPSDRVYVTDADVREIIPHVSLFVTRFSSTAVDALCLGRPVLTHNSPPIPGGTLYEELGGTLHAATDQEFGAIVCGLVADRGTRELAARRRVEFLSHYVRIDQEPATDRFVRLVERLCGASTAGTVHRVDSPATDPSLATAHDHG